MTQINIYAKKDGKYVNLKDLPEDEAKRIGRCAAQTLMDSIMFSKGYVREKPGEKKKA